MKIAIVKLSAMGDIIHAMISLQFLKKSIPNIKIDWFVEKYFLQILEFNPHINNIYTLDLKSIKTSKKNIFKEIKKIREYSKNNYDLVIDAQGLIKSAIVSRILCKNVVGFDNNCIRESSASFFYTKKIQSPYEKNVIQRNLDVICKVLRVDVFKDDILKKDAFLFFKYEHKVVYELLSKEKKNILFVVGASWSSKMYSKEKFAKIINCLDENCLIAWGNEKEKSIASEISLLSKAKILPKLDLNSLKAIISNCDLVIGNDTGPTHMAWALNIPSITLFGCTPGFRNTYETKINKILESDSKVKPLALDKKDFSIKNIDERRVLDLIRRLIKVNI